MGLRGTLTKEKGLAKPKKETLQARAELAGAAAERERLGGALAAREADLAAAQARARQSTTPGGRRVLAGLGRLWRPGVIGVA